MIFISKFPQSVLQNHFSMNVEVLNYCSVLAPFYLCKNVAFHWDQACCYYLFKIKSVLLTCQSVCNSLFFF